MALNIRSIGNAVRGALRFLNGLGGSAPTSSGRPAVKTRAGQPAPKPGRKPARKPGAGTGAAGGGLAGRYPGDFRGAAAVRYAPSPNGRPEPGEVVWTWVPFEEDHSQGKDRPVLLVGTSGRHLLGLMLTSKDHDGDSRRADDYVDIGTGPWDRQWRPSEAKLDRVLRINPKDVRREGAVLDAGRFSLVAAALRARHGWS
jgi:PemK-like, MazF-like toxin of type II toxin-antitoxin system